MSVYGTQADILQTALEWLRQEQHATALVTVIRTWGSSPRPVGSLMLIRSDGMHLGSVSGGCVEEDLLQRYRNGEISREHPALIDYGVDPEQARAFGLPCGGRLELIVETLKETDTEQFSYLLEENVEGRLSIRHVDLGSGWVSLLPASPEDEFEYDGETMQQIFGPLWHLLIIGSGHLAHYIARIALTLDYRITVCDPREDYASNWQLEGTRISRMMPDDAVKQVVGHERVIVLALTHDPKLDDMALWEALQSQAFYIGALGSKRNNDERRKRLKQLGLSSIQLKRLRGPVGLSIGSHTPAEIAVATMAEIIAERHGIKMTPEN